MDQELFAKVDDYITGVLHLEDPVLDAALATSREAGLPTIQVSAPQGKFLHLLARSMKAERVLELGTLGGYSTIWLARSLPASGRLISLEISPAHAEVARANLERAGLAAQVEVRLGPALDSLRELAEEGTEAFDLVFIDADKPLCADYLEASLPLTRRGGVIVVDNVVRRGGVIDGSSNDPNVLGVRRLFELLERDHRVEATALQTVGGKGHDGFVMAVVS